MRTPVLIITSLWLLSQPAMADRDAERQALAQLIHELKALQPLIDHAQHNANHENNRGQNNRGQRIIGVRIIGVRVTLIIFQLKY